MHGRRRPVLLALYSCLVAGRGLLAPAEAATFRVDSTLDAVDAMPGDGICASAGGPCTLRAAVQESNANRLTTTGKDTIVLPAGTYTITIVGEESDAAAGDIDIKSTLEIVGAGASSTIVDANGVERAFKIVDHGDATIRDVTISNGSVGGSGGGIFNVGGTLTLIDSVVTGNMAATGGGIENFVTAILVRSTVTGNVVSGAGGAIRSYYGATLTLIDSTLSDNRAGETGGGIRTFSDGVLTVANSTISGNSAGIEGGGVEFAAEEGTLVNCTVSGNRAPVGGGIFRRSRPDEGRDSVGELRLLNATVANNAAGLGGGGIASPAAGLVLANTIIAGNTDDSGQAPQCMGTVTSGRHNLVETLAGCSLAGESASDVIGGSANLGQLEDNGGPTFTHALLPGSPAIDTGSEEIPGRGADACAATDQRGIVRPRGAGCDIGAYESEPNLCSEVLTGCKRPARGKSRLLLVDQSPGLDRVQWGWTRGAATALSDLGDPAAATDYILCVFDTSGGTESPMLGLIAPAGRTCAGDPCWQGSPTGFTHKGLLALRLRAGGQGHASISAASQQAVLLRALPLPPTPKLTVQLRKSDGPPCWDAEFSAHIAARAGRLTARSD